ncbi:hypothetical protein ACMV8I_18735 [Ewingella sp. S1.OA.A_B6]
MNNDLEQFSEERLIDISTKALVSMDEAAALARIALSVKQAKPVGHFSRVNGDGIWFESWSDKLGAPLYDTPQPPHTEQYGWTSNDAANAALVMLDRIDTTDSVDDDRIEGIKRIIRQLAAAPKPESE